LIKQKAFDKLKTTNFPDLISPRFSLGSPINRFRNGSLLGSPRGIQLSPDVNFDADPSSAYEIADLAGRISFE